MIASRPGFPAASTSFSMRRNNDTRFNMLLDVAVGQMVSQDDWNHWIPRHATASIGEKSASNIATSIASRQHIDGILYK